MRKEKGMDTYLKVDDSKCLVAKNWWGQNKKIWHEIQAMWKHVQGHHPEFTLKGPIDGKTLWMRLFELAEIAAQAEASGQAMGGDVIQGRAHDIIHEYMIVAGH